MEICGSSYLNSALTVAAFEDKIFGDRYNFTSIPQPSRCARQLESGAADIALIPVIEYQRIPDLVVIPELCVSAHGKVRSVLLFSKRPIDVVKSVKLDSASRTSQALIKILLENYYQLKPVYREFDTDYAELNLPELLDDADAVLCIADPALKAATEEKNGDLLIYDLAELWNQFTGLSFTFAFWCARKASLALSPQASSKIMDDFKQAKEYGLSRIDDILSRNKPKFSLTESELRKYLTLDIRYDFGSYNSQGLEKFYQMAAKLGLIDRNKELCFLTQEL